MEKLKLFFKKNSDLIVDVSVSVVLFMCFLILGTMEIYIFKLIFFGS